MSAHLSYLRYVLRHKWYVLRAGLLLNGWRPAWVLRLLVHDLSKFRPGEWRPYVAMFYGVPGQRSDARHPFEIAWLKHIHRNPHHWQHWLLQQDDGKQLVLLIPPVVVDEMVCDWVGAGQKINGPLTMREAVVETLKWYTANAAVMKLRTPVRLRVELQLVELAARVGIVGAQITTSLETVTIPRGRVGHA